MSLFHASGPFFKQHHKGTNNQRENRFSANECVHALNCLKVFGGPCNQQNLNANNIVQRPAPVSCDFNTRICAGFANEPCKDTADFILSRGMGESIKDAGKPCHCPQCPR